MGWHVTDRSHAGTKAPGFHFVIPNPEHRMATGGFAEDHGPVITGLSQVVIQVDDQDAAKRFWTERIGMAVDSDETFGDERWIELRPPEGAPRIVLSLRPADQPRAQARDEHPHSPLFFHCEDIGATYNELRDRGVDFPQPPVEMPFGWWAMFADQEGNRYALGQRE